ncbi:hypothetical protein JB92DRAFT_3113290 [Gautieria morchelliformis]|nr:hypothetical protein JB92DRAFT_3113290 [Gautieria morchelliformis]
MPMPSSVSPAPEPTRSVPAVLMPKAESPLPKAADAQSFGITPPPTKTEAASMPRASKAVLRAAATYASIANVSKLAEVLVTAYRKGTVPLPLEPSGVFGNVYAHLAEVTVTTVGWTPDQDHKFVSLVKAHA